ncbi:hypothetical protein [Delftia sp. UME58]|uniref:hypothetical protein n=1 Tax=Delftia sp. UME58 TaxID=1862322 RepID=UPI0015FFDCDE|nr:hypothetical protein [Delftia sp. UME58]
MDIKYSMLLRTAYDAYLVRWDEGEMGPSERYLPYDFEQIDRYQWSLLGAEMVRDELRELTNLLNGWLGLLRRWKAWNSVIAGYEKDDAWELRREFLEALAHQCLLLPSAMRDTFTFVATNSMHQVRLAQDASYPDRIDGDPTTHDEKPRHLTRRQKEQRLLKLLAPWSVAKKFVNLICSLDAHDYRSATSDYRNRTSHAIGPRLGIGMTRAVVRSVKPATEHKKQANGTYEMVRIPGRMSVGYGWGGTLPLDIEDACTVNLEQFRRARACYECYWSLLLDGMKGIPLIPRTSGAN